MKKRFLFGSMAIASLALTLTACGTESTNEGGGTGSGNGNNDNPSTPTSTMYTHKTLIEDFTGTWCPYCPRVAYSIELVTAHQTLGDKIIPVAAHIGDSMQISAGSSINSFMGVTSYPTAMINREKKWSTPENNKLAEVYNSIQQAGVPVGIKIASNVTTTSATVTASFKFSQGYENLKYNIYVLENNVVRSSDPQKNSTSFYGGSGEKPDFVHNDVLRGVYGNARGNELGTVTAGQEIVKDGQSVNFTLYNNDLSKVDIVVFVTDSTGKKVLNAQVAHANETVDYQVVK